MSFISKQYCTRGQIFPSSLMTTSCSSAQLLLLLPVYAFQLLLHMHLQLHLLFSISIFNLLLFLSYLTLTIQFYIATVYTCVLWNEVNHRQTNPNCFYSITFCNLCWALQNAVFKLIYNFVSNIVQLFAKSNSDFVLFLWYFTV